MRKSKPSRLPNVKEESAAGAAKAKNEVGNGKGRMPHAVMRQSATLDKTMPLSVQSQSASLDKTMPLSVLSQSASLDKTMPLSVQSQSANLDQTMPLSVRRQSARLNQTMPLSVMQQSAGLNQDMPFSVMQQSAELTVPTIVPPPPGSAPPPPSNALPPPQPPLLFSAKDLKLGMKKLKKANEIIKQVDLDRQHFFDTIKQYQYMPLMDTREAIRMKALRSEISSINFDGIEQMSDAFLYSLCHCKLDIQTIKYLSFTGCYHITDEGVYWLLQAFGNNLQSVAMNGCEKLTEKSLHYFSTCSSLKEVHLTGTNCKIIPQYVYEKKHPVTGKDYKVSVYGSRIVSPLRTNNDQAVQLPKKPFTVPYRKIVILSPDDLPWNAMAVLTNQTDTTVKPGFTYKQDWRPFKDFGITDVKSSAEVFNIFQMAGEKGLGEMIVSSGSIVILPYYLHKDMTKNPALKLASLIASVITKCQDCTFVLFGMSSTSDSVDYTDTVKQMEQNVLTYIANWKKRLNKTLRTAINTNWRMTALHYWDQELLSSEIFMIENLKYFEMEDKIITSSLVRVGSGSKMSAQDFKFLKEIVEVDEKHFTWNRTPMICDEALKYSNNLKKNPLTLTNLSEFHKQCTLQSQNRPLFISQVKSLAEFAALWGHALYFPTLKGKPVVTDFKFLSDVISQLMFTSASKTCNLRCLEGNIPYWTKADLLNLWKGSSEKQGESLIQLFEKAGLLLKLPVDPWSSVQDDVSFVYILYKDFPVQQPTILSGYWPLKLPDKVTELERYYFGCPGLPDSFFPNLLRHMFKLGAPAILWRDGAVFIKGHLRLLVEKLLVGGMPVVLVQVRSPPNSELKHEEGWTLLKLYTNIVDYLIMKYGIPVAKAVPCCFCRPNKDRYEIIMDGKVERFFLEHLIHSVQSSRLQCSVCKNEYHKSVMVGDEQINPFSLNMAGPDIELSNLIPCHDKNGCALYTNNTLNRCMMCENCAVDGIDCTVNLRKGKRNWHCDCNKQGKLCDYCGICQRCANYIRKTVASVEERKFAPNNQDIMSKSDELKIIENGSILGLISENLEKTLESNILRPNYCQDMYLTAVNHGNFAVTLTLGSPNETKVKFDSVTGKVSKNETVSAGNKNRGFQLGDTLHISVKYIQGDFTRMRLTLFYNEGEIFGEEMEAQKVTVSISSQKSDEEGVFLTIRTPGKFDCSVVKFTKGTKKICGSAVANLPCFFEMTVFNHLEKMEQICYGGRGLSLSGSSCLSLPSKITMEILKHPHVNSIPDKTYHHLCLSFNPVGGKSKLGKFAVESKNDQSSSETFEVRRQLHLSDRDTSETWEMRRLIHLLDAPGIPYSECKSTISEESEYLLMVWHFIYLTFPEVMLPSSTSKLLPDLNLTDSNVLKIKEGLNSLVRVSFWNYLTKFGVDDLSEKFKVQMLTARNEIVRSALAVQEILLENIEKTGLKEVPSIFNKNNCLYLCPGHANCIQTSAKLPEISPDMFGLYSEFITFVDVSCNSLTGIPEEFFVPLKNLTDFKCSTNMIEKIPGTIGFCKKLHGLLVYENNLTDLPQELTSLKNLSILECGNNRFSRVPYIVTKIQSLTKLSVINMLLTELPEDIGNLVNLKSLIANGNCLTKLPDSFSKLVELTELGLSGIHWLRLSGNQENVSYQQFYHQTLRRRIERWLRAIERDHSDIFRKFDENSNGVLDIKEVGKLNAAMFNLFPRFGYKGKEPPDDSTPDGFPRQILDCKKLKTLIITQHGFTKVPKEICKLENLIELHVSHNPNLLSIPAEISELKCIKRLELEDCPLLKTPPREIRDKGFSATFAYLKRLMSGAASSKRTKLMFVGLGGAGKTSLVKALMNKHGKAELEHAEGITDGIDIQTWTVKHQNNEITYNIWDFAGQTVYYNTHQFFLSPNRAVYVLLWNVRLGYEHAGLDFWLSSIKVQAPGAPVFVIGSHIDQVSKSELPIEEMSQRYPQVVGFHFISSYTGQGINELKKNLFDVTLQQQYMGENIPTVWFTFEKSINLMKKKEDVVTYQSIVTVANRSGIFDTSEIFQAVQFLHDLGSVQHFANEYLKSHVVINPQWIVDVMACVVSVKNDVIKDGRLNHSDLEEIWKAYPKKLHKWLLRLTEEFDLTFKLQDENVNLVPCLLPETKPKFDWPDIERGSDILETEMEYTFDYLPAGLFNRAQVRLHDLSDRAIIWKNGSFLKKNVHIALLQQTRGDKLLVKAQGPRPENILFLVHEVFEGLIVESFNGVTFDFTMPCPECQKMIVKDQHMFSASTIRRALDMKAPFLQCVKYFHIISCSNLQTLLPPDSHGDFDAHLVHSIQGLKDLHKDIAADIFISFCDADNKLKSPQYIVPQRVCKDLVNQGYKCWFGGDSMNHSTDEMARALIDSSVFVAFMSTNYTDDMECVNFFKYAKLTLKKPIIVVAIGDDFAWKQSTLGLLLADEVFINMTKQKSEFYDSKYSELISAFKGKTRTVTDNLSKPVVFFSYTWVNSASAVALGTRESPGALGYGDPRKLKKYLEENGLSCWIDVERVGMNGLFDDIANGLLSAKVVIVCMSDEYAMSPTCQTEFRYAAGTLKLPIILAVVGTGDAWRSKEVGLMSVQYPIVNFQEETKNGKKKLLSLVNNYLKQAADNSDEKKLKNRTNAKHKNLSYTELFELAQRKLLRQLTIYAENQDLDVYPRLFVVDIMKEENDKVLITTDTESDKKEKEANGEEKADIPDGYQNRKTLGKHASVMSVPAFKMMRFCVYTLCEHDEGWHSVAKPIELPPEFGVQSLDEYCPFLSRVTTVMKYNKKLSLSCFSDEVGKAYVEWLEKNPDATMSDYQTVYHSFRDMMQSLDTDLNMGNLSRCHLNSGKTIWLCNKHRDSMRVTCLSNEEKGMNSTKDADSKVNNYMLTSLRELDPNMMKFEAKPNAPILPSDIQYPKQGVQEDLIKKKVSERHHRYNKHKLTKAPSEPGVPDEEKNVEAEVANDETDAKKVKEGEASRPVPGENKPTNLKRQTSAQSTISTDQESLSSERSQPKGHHHSRRQTNQRPRNLTRKETSRACVIS